MKEAVAGVDLAKLQQERAKIQVEHYTDLLDEDQIALETAAVTAMIGAGTAHLAASFFSAGEAAAALAQTAQNPLNVRFVRRGEEWKFQKNVAAQA